MLGMFLDKSNIGDLSKTNITIDPWKGEKS
jgi:hypothetical protein